MKLANKIQASLIIWARGNTDIIIPNFYYGNTECDLFKITGSDFVIEYEIKISRSDFFADFKKQGGKKHLHLQGGSTHCPNRFYYVMPAGLIKVDECPKYAGLLEWNQYESFDTLKNAPLIHKQKFQNYRMISKTLAFREAGLRGKIRSIVNQYAESQLEFCKRELEWERSERIKAQNELFLLKFKKAI